MNILKFLRKVKNKLKILLSKIKPKEDLNKVFNDIYKNRLWGNDDEDDRLFSGEGSFDCRITDQYVKTIKILLQKLQMSSVLDLGCGDFEVGKEFIPYVNKYIAADISSLIIEQNKKRYAGSGVSFIHLDESIEKFPSADIIIIRQVFQHLSNDHIDAVLHKIQNSEAKYLLVTEHLPIDKEFTANIDKPSGAGIRLGLGSGVDIQKYPFKFSIKSSEVLLSIQTVAEGMKSRIVTKLYTL